MTTLVRRNDKAVKRSRKRGLRSKGFSERQIEFESVRRGLARILGEAATTVVLNQIFLDRQMQLLQDGDLDSLRAGLEEFFGAAGSMLYSQVVGTKAAAKRR